MKVSIRPCSQMWFIGSIAYLGNVTELISINLEDGPESIGRKDLGLSIGVGWEFKLIPRYVIISLSFMSVNVDLPRDAYSFRCFLTLEQSFRSIPRCC